MTIEDQINRECEGIARMLIAKNRKYGNSALAPLRVFSRADRVEQLRVRIDDKLSRIATSGDSGPDEDTVADLLGYLVLYRIASRPEPTVKESLTAGYAVPPFPSESDDDPAVVHLVPDRTSRATAPEHCLGNLCRRGEQ